MIATASWHGRLFAFAIFATKCFEASYWRTQSVNKNFLNTGVTSVTSTLTSEVSLLQFKRYSEDNNNGCEDNNEADVDYDN